MRENHDINLDVIRISAMFLIVLMHSPMPGSSIGFVLSSLSYITAPGIGLFFMVSGALLLDSDLNTKEFFKRRFSKILWPTLFWTFFYMVLSFISSPTSASSTILAILSIPFSAQGHGVLWFMYTLSGLYLVTPVLTKWIKHSSKREIELYLLLWGISLCLPYVSYLGIDVNDKADGIIYYFTGYIGYYLLGYYLEHLYEYKKWHLTFALLVAFVLPALLYGFKFKFDFYQLLWYLSIPVACLSFSYWVLISKLRILRESKFIMLTSSLCFGIYLVHIFIMRSIIWRIDFVKSMKGIVSILFIAVATFMFSWVVSYLISKLPFSKYIIGK